jgi:hypothetical protein
MSKLYSRLLFVFTSSFLSYFLLPWEFTIGIFIAGMIMLSYNLFLDSINCVGSCNEEQ